MKCITTSGVAVSLCLLAGCAGPGPKLFPIAPIEVRRLPDGVTERWYDITGDQRGDRCEQLGRDGRVARIGYADGAGTVEYVTLGDIPPNEQQHLILLLDSIPFSMVDDAYAAGRLRYCHAPGRVIAPFPVMTDLCFSDFFGNSPSPGIESQHYDGERLTSGYETYASGGNVPWQKYVDYRLHPILHAQAYLDPYPWLDHELRAIRERFLRAGGNRYVGYVVGTSAVGAKYGRDGHQVAIVRLDRLCLDLLFATRGRARFTMLSDHGHAFYHDSSWLNLSDVLEDMGYHAGKRLRNATDLVVPEFGMVSSAVIHTRTPAPVARDAVGIDGVEITAYMEGPDMIVVGRDSLARVSFRDGRFRYTPQRGDPLELNPVLDMLAQKGLIDEQGYVRDGDLFLASVEARYPDAVQRLWRAFHGLVEHTPDVLLSLNERYFVGDASMTRLIDLVGIHGSLGQASSSGFAITMAGPLAPVQRMPDLRSSLQSLQVPIGGVDNAELMKMGAAEADSGVNGAPVYNRYDLLTVMDERGESRAVQSAEDWQRRREHIISNMKRVMGPVPAQWKTLPLDVKVLGEEHLPNLIRKRITFRAEPADEVAAYLMIPTGRPGPRAAMLCLPQTVATSKDEPAGLGPDPRQPYALELTQRGFVTLTPDYWPFGDYRARKYDPYQHGYVSGTMKGIWNHMRAIDVLGQLPEVDPERIGSIGHSLGGHNTLWVAALDPRVKVAATSCGFTSMPAYAASKYGGGDLKNYAQDRYMPLIESAYGNDPDRLPWDFPEVLAAIAPRPVFINAPLRDVNFDVAGVRECVSAARKVYAWMNAEAALQVVYPDAEHVWPLAERTAAYAFIEQALRVHP